MFGTKHESCLAHEIPMEHDLASIALAQSKDMVLEARHALFLTACHEGRWSVSEDEYLNQDPEVLDNSNEINQLAQIYAEANAKLKRYYCELLVQESNEARKLKIRDLLASLIDSKQRDHDLLQASLHDEQFLHDQLTIKLNKLTSPSTSDSQDPDQKQTALFQKWMTQRLGSISRHDSTHATLRLASTSSARQKHAPLIRGMIQRGTFGNQMLKDIQVVYDSTEAASWARLSTQSLCPSIIVARILQQLRVDTAIAQDLTRLSALYALDWDRERRQLQLLTGPGGVAMATIRLDSDGQLALVQIRHSSSCAGDKQRADEPHDDDTNYVPPLPRSLDEWLMDISDFCHSNV